ncbi:MAG: M56 family metallopeptidase [Bacteroidota bacterium]
MKHELFTYLLEASVIMTVLGLFYWVFFRKLTFYRINRSLVILTVVAALFMPLIQIDINPSSDLVLKNLSVPEISFQQNFDANSDDELNEAFGEAELASAGNIQAEVATQNSSFDWYLLIGAIYLLGVLFAVIRLVLSLLKFYKIRKKADYYQPTQHYVIPENGQSFSFFNWIFIDPETMDSDEYQVVLKHERVHARLLHSFDVLLFELGKSIFWFNPLIYLLAKESRLVNEFHTDQMVVKEEGLEVYSNTLINYQQNLFKRNGALLVANSFAQLSLKPRVMQLVKKPSDYRSRWSYLAFVPILSLLFITFSCGIDEAPEYGENVQNVKAYYFDEFGDQQERNGDLLVDLDLNPDGTLGYEGLTMLKSGFLQKTLGYVMWGAEVNILQHKNQWPEIKQSAIRKTIDEYINMEQNRERFIVDKDSPEGRAVKHTYNEIRSTDANGFEVIKVQGADEQGKVWSTFIIDRGELYEYDEAGRIKSIRYNVFDEESYMKQTEAKSQGITMTVDLSEFINKVERYDFTYDESNNLISSSYNGELSKTFQYDDNNRLVKINRYKNETLVSYYQLNYNDQNHFSKVTAYNGTGGLEFTAKYEYQYY